MALTIDNLEIQIQTEASKAKNGIDNLAKSMERLKVAVGDTSGLASNLTQISSALKTFNGIGKINLTAKINQLSKLQDLIPLLGGAGATQLSDNLRELASAITAFSAIPKLNVNVGSIAKAIQDLNTTTASFDSARLSDFSVQMQGIAGGLSHLSAVGKGNFSSLINSLKKLPEITASLDTATLDAFAEKMQRLADIMAPLATEMDAVARGFNALPKSIKRAISANNQAIRSNNKLSLSFKDLMKSYSSIAKGLERFWHNAKRVYDVLFDLFEESNEYIEALNLFEVSMGDAADSAREYAETVSELMGIDIAEWITNQGMLMRTMVGFGVVEEEAELMSKNLTQLGYDLASFFNVDVATAFDKLESGMTGQIKGLKEYGLNLSVAALEETALKLGIDESVRSMTEAQKAQLRYITLLQNSNGIMGDMAKTIMTPANSMRILQAQIKRMQRALGNLVSVIAVKVIPWCMALVEIIEEMATELAEAWGFELPELPENDLKITVDTDGLEEAEDEAKELKKQLMGFDELNILKSDKEEKENPSYSLGIDLPEYDFLNGFEGLDLEPYKEKLKEILDLVKLIGIAFTTWKVGSSIFSFLNHGGWSTINKLLNKGSTNLPQIAGKVGGISQSLQLAAGAALTISGAFVETKSVIDALGEGFDWENVLGIGGGSASIVGGGALIGKTLGNTLVGSFVGVVLSGLSMFIPSVVDLFKNGIDWENAILVPLGSTLTGAGVGALVGLAGGPFGAVVGALAGAAIGLMVDAVGLWVDYFNDDAIPAVELFDETISESTRNAVEPFLEKTRELSNLSFELEIKGAKFTDFSDITFKIDTIKQRAIDAGRALTAEEEQAIAHLESLKSQLEMDGFVDVSVMKNQGNEIFDAVGTALNTKKDADFGKLSLLSDYLNPSEMSMIQGSLFDFYTQNEKELNNHKTRYNEILDTAAKENRALTEAEWAEINSIEKSMQDLGVQSLSQTRVEAETIMRNLKDNTTRISLEQAGEIIKNAQNTRDETIKAAEDQYSEIKLWADDMLAVGDINEQEYAAIITAAENARKETVDEAELQYNEILQATKNKLGENAKYIDEKTGSIKSNWDVFCDGLKEGWNNTWDDVKRFVTKTIPDMWDNHIAPWFTKEKWTELFSSIKTAFSDKWGELVEWWDNSAIKTWWDEHVAPWFTKEKWQELFDNAFGDIKIKLPHFSWDDKSGIKATGAMKEALEWLHLPTSIPKLKVSWYAEGGFPTTGQMFIAREAGPELVGRIGNKTAVANNDQITQGIASAVYSAMMAAQAEGNSGGSTNARIIVQIGERAVGEAAVRFINGQVVQTGSSPLYAY